MSTKESEFSDFFRAEFPHLVRVAYLIVQDRAAAEDVAQEACTRLHQHWRRIRRYDYPPGWVRRVAVNLAISHAQRSSRRESLALPKTEDIATADLRHDMRNAVAGLPPKERAAVALFYLEDYSLAEVAHALECSESAAGVRLHRARKRLAEVLGKEVDADAT